jgi:hypothetical protein
LTRRAKAAKNCGVGRVRSRGGAVAALVAAVAVLSSDALAAAPAATPQTATFRVTVRGSISSAVNTYPEASARCRPASEIGLWRHVTFHSARPTLVTVVGARGSRKPVRFKGKVRRLLGEIHLAAPSQYELVCPDGTRMTVRGEYFTGSTSWRGGAVRLRSPRRGRIVLGPLRGVPQDPSGACGQASGAPLALELAPGRLAEAKLLNPRLRRLVVRGGKRRSARPSPTCGVSESVEWKVVFRRVR